MLWEQKKKRRKKEKADDDSDCNPTISVHVFLVVLQNVKKKRPSVSTQSADKETALVIKRGGKGSTLPENK